MYDHFSYDEADTFGDFFREVALSEDGIIYRKAAADKNMQTKVHLWDNMMQGNVLPLMYHLLANHVPPVMWIG